jgi:rubredoxin
MPMIAQYADVKAGKKTRNPPGGGTSWRTDFMRPPEGVLDYPMAFLAEGTPHRVIKPHFHEVDQFQVIVSGGGVIGHHPLSINAVHFSRAHTPYGPLTGADQGVAFLTLRAHWDPGAQYLQNEESKKKLINVPDRKPWQATEAPDFNGDADVNIKSFKEIKDERGLGAFSIKLAAGATLQTPDPAQTNGQYLIVVKGSLTYQGKEYKAISIAFTKPNEGSFPVVAGPEGVEALVLNFPRLEAAKPVVAEPSNKQAFRVWQCLLCAFVYDEAKGMPEDGIAAGTRWEDVPDTWTCPDCAASKADFDMAVVA